MLKTVKNILTNSTFYHYVKALLVERKYFNEQNYYSKINTDIDQVKDIYNRVLSKKKESGNSFIHFFDIRGSEWEHYNIKPALESFGDYNQILLGELDNVSEKCANLIGLVSEKIRPDKNNIFITCLGRNQGADENFFDFLEKNKVISIFFNFDDDLHFSGKYSNGYWSGPRDITRYVDVHLTSSTKSIKKYLVEGGRPIYCAVGANHNLFRLLDKEIKYDVVFVGQLYGFRKKFIDYLIKNGIKVEVFGKGSKNGTPTFEEMNIIWNQSKIVLGHGGIGYSQKLRHLKGRDFEATMSGACYVTTYHDDLKNLFKEDEEIVFYDTKEECLQKIKYLLANPAKIEQIKRNMMKNRETHSWEKRFRDIFSEVGILMSGKENTDE